MFVYSRLHHCHISSVKIITGKSFLNEKFIQLSLCCLRLRKKRIQFLIQDERFASDLKELQFRFEVNLLTHAEHVFQKFHKKCLEYEESVN